MIDFSFIVPFHSNKMLLETCLDSLYKTVYGNFEVIVVANNYNENEITVKFDYPNLHILHIKKNLYYSAAVNLGASYAKGKYILFCDTDTVYTPGWFEALISAFTNNKSVGFASPKLLNPWNGRVIDFGVAFTPFNGPHPFKGSMVNDPLVQNSFYPQTACSASGIMEKNVFFNMGGFNEELGYSYADVDLCLRLKEKNLRTLGVASSYVYHKGNSVLSEMTTFIKSDIKAKFMAYNANRICIDLNNYYYLSKKNYLLSHTLEKQYFLVEMSSVYDKDWYFRVLEDQNIHISDIYYVGINSRDISRINLYEKLPLYIQLLKFPVIYFVDEYTSLQDNHLWAQLRSCDKDIVVDRNANIRNLQEIIENVC